MRGTARNVFIMFSALGLVVLMPAVGVFLSGGDIARYLEFPPQTVYMVHSPFSRTVFVALLLAVVLPLVHPALHILRNLPLPSDRSAAGSMPSWGKLSLGLCLTAWFIAWTRMPVFAPVQRWTFFPLWLSFIVALNGVCVMRTGTSLLTERPVYMARLFILSAAFWWVFEYLNRFTLNWFYQGTGDLSPLRYFSEASVAFSTVLPAVMSMAELVKSFPGLYGGMKRYVVIRNTSPRLAAIPALAAGCAGLAFTPVFPEWLFPLLWVAPFVIMASLSVLAGRQTILSGIASGDWCALVIYPLAALACGFFWEMWNMGSMARWVYSIPYVHAFRIFEMPLPGYAGYLPFGLECALVAGMAAGEGEEPWRYTPGE